MAMESGASIEGSLRRTAFRCRLISLVWGVSLTGLGLTSLLGLGVGLALLIPPRSTGFLIYGLLFWLVTILLLYATLRPLRLPLREESAARLFERRHPDLEGRLVSALELGRERETLVHRLGYSGAMIDAFRGEVARLLPAVLSRPLGVRRPVSLVLLSCLLATIPLFLMARALPGEFRQVLSLVADPLRAGPFLRASVAVTPGAITLGEGAALRIEARPEGTVEGALTLAVRRPGEADPSGRIPMTRETPSLHVHSIPRLVESFDYRVEGEGVTSPWFEVTVATLPRAGDIAITLLPPGYTGLEPTTVKGTGSIRCLRGTTVSWTATATKPLQEAVLVTPDGGRNPLRIEDGTRLSGTFLAMGQGRYRVVLRDTQGFGEDAPDEYDLSLIPDEVPQVELASPGSDLEVDAASLVDVVFTARDDFGLTAAALVWGTDDGATGRIPLPVVPGRRLEGSGFSWDLAPLGLDPGRQVSFHVEVTDNDTISGPKSGSSPDRTIRLKDDRAVHQDLAALEKEALDALTDVLADELEVQDSLEGVRTPARVPDTRFRDQLDSTAKEQRAALEKFDGAMNKLDDFLSRAANDPLENPSALFRKVLARQMLQKTLQGERDEARQMGEILGDPEMKVPDARGEVSWMADRKETRLAEMEQALNLLQDAARYQKMEETVRTAESMLERQKDLAERLEKLADKFSARDLHQAGELFREVAQMMNDLMNTLSRMQTELPEDFANAESMQNLPLEDLAAELEKLADALKSGDLERARALAESLLKRMGELLDRLKEGARHQRDLNREAMDDFRKRRMGELEKIIVEQRDLLRATEEISRALAPRVAARRKALQAELTTQTRRTAELLRDRHLVLRRNAAWRERFGTPGAEPMAVLGRDIDSLELDAEFNLPRLRKSLDTVAEDLDRLTALFSGEAGQVAALLEEMREAVRRDAVVATTLAELESDTATAGERNLLSGLAVKEGELVERTRRLGEKMGNLAKIFAMIPMELPRNLAEAADFMHEASQRLQGYLPGEAVPPEREALYRLMQAQSQAETAGQQMGQMMGLQSGSSQAMGEAQGLFGLLPSASASSQAGQREGGRAGISLRNFRIPGSGEYRVPRAFREEIQESLRSGYHPLFEKSIRQYFRSITE
jgi:methyl-accepting chemotaxis protein